MNNDLDLQSNAAIIRQSLEELHTLISVLEEQIKSGLFPAQLESEIESVMQEERSPVLEDGSFVTDWV